MARPAATPETRSVRLLKVGEQVRHVMSELLMRQEVHDDVLTAHSISVTEVRMSPDRPNPAYFQREVAQGLKLKFAARLKFLPDESFDEASRIDALLADPRVTRDLGE